MAIDVGRKTLGVAVSDPLLLTARGVVTLRRGDPEAELAELRGLVDTWEISQIVVGLPRRTDGSLGPEAEQADRFARLVEERLGVPVELWDERFSTVEAERAMIAGGVRRAGRRAVIDQVAAAIFLQSYLDRHRDRLMQRERPPSAP